MRSAIIKDNMRIITIANLKKELEIKKRFPVSVTMIDEKIIFIINGRMETTKKDETIHHSTLILLD